MSMLNKKYEILSHTADLKIKFYGKSFRELIDSVFSFYRDNLKILSVEKKTTHDKIIIEDEGFEFLVVRLLNELIYFKELGKFIKEYDIIELTENSLIIDVIILKGKFEFIEELKSATYHELKMEKKDNFFELTIVIDV